MSSDPYGDRVRALFADPAHAGCLEDGVSAAAATADVRLCLCARHSGGKLESLRFRAWGCPHVIAAAEAFCAGYEGRPIATLLEFSAFDLMQSLPVPKEKTGRILVLEDVVHELGASLCAVDQD